jgi:hypothetical protein
VYSGDRNRRPLCRDAPPIMVESFVAGQRSRHWVSSTRWWASATNSAIRCAAPLRPSYSRFSRRPPRPAHRPRGQRQGRCFVVTDDVPTGIVLDGVRRTRRRQPQRWVDQHRAGRTRLAAAGEPRGLENRTPMLSPTGRCEESVCAPRRSGVRPIRHAVPTKIWCSSYHILVARLL